MFLFGTDKKEQIIEKKKSQKQLKQFRESENFENYNLDRSSGVVAHNHSYNNNENVPKSNRDILLQENNNLKRKLYLLTQRLEEYLGALQQKTAKNQPNNYIKQVLAPQNQSLQLQSAYKMIERLQKVYHSYENKQSFQITLKKIQQLDNIIKIRTDETEKLKTQLKYVNKSIKDKEKYIQYLDDNKAVIPNDQQQKKMITQLKLKLKKLTAQNQTLKRKQLQKHKKLVTVEHKILDKQKQEYDQTPSKQEQVQKQILQYRKKHQEALNRIKKQNIYIDKLSKKLAIIETDPKVALQNQMRKKQKRRNSQDSGYIGISNKKIKTREQIQEIIEIEDNNRNQGAQIYNDKNMPQKYVVKSNIQIQEPRKHQQITKNRNINKSQQIRNDKNKSLDSIQIQKMQHRVLRRF